MGGGEVGLQGEEGNWQLFLYAEVLGRIALGILLISWGIRAKNSNEYIKTKKMGGNDTY